LHSAAGDAVSPQIRRRAEEAMGERARVLADRIEKGADQLGAFARGLSDAQWRTAVPGDGRTVGIVVHHVANVYPIEIDLARSLAAGKPVTGVTWDVVNDMNAKHARDHASIGKAETLEHLQRNSRSAAEAVRALTDAELDRAAAISLYADAVLTSQFVIEDHAVRHSLHHLARLRKTLGL
jgi:hypothetical protein